MAARSLAKYCQLNLEARCANPTDYASERHRRPSLADVRDGLKPGTAACLYAIAN